jgi:hypothetical protein
MPRVHVPYAPALVLSLQGMCSDKRSTKTTHRYLRWGPFAGKSVLKYPGPKGPQRRPGARRAAGEVRHRRRDGKRDRGQIARHICSLPQVATPRMLSDLGSASEG